MKNKLSRLWLKFLYIGYSCYCYIFRPRVCGAYVLVSSVDKILIIKNSYKKGWTFPCGMIHRGETEVEGAQRELMEEVGIHVETKDLKFLKEFVSTSGYKTDHQFFFHIYFSSLPNIVLDMTEVIQYKWVTLQEMDLIDLPDGVVEVTHEFKDFIFEQKV